MVPRLCGVGAHRHYRFLVAFAAGFLLAAFFAVFLAMAYPPFPGGLLGRPLTGHRLRSQRCLPRSRPVMVDEDSRSMRPENGRRPPIESGSRRVSN